MKYVIEYNLEYFFNKTQPIEANSIEDLVTIFRKELKKLGISSEHELDSINIIIVEGCDFCETEIDKTLSETTTLSLYDDELFIDVYGGHCDFIECCDVKINFCPFCGRKL